MELYVFIQLYIIWKTKNMQTSFCVAYFNNAPIWLHPFIPTWTKKQDNMGHGLTYLGGHFKSIQSQAAYCVVLNGDDKLVSMCISMKYSWKRIWGDIRKLLLATSRMPVWAVCLHWCNWSIDRVQGYEVHHCDIMSGLYVMSQDRIRASVI